MTLHLYNTLTRKKEAFAPMDDKDVRMYVCGPTVYDRPHIGNARSVVVYDVLYRLLCHVYGKNHVTYVRNITDVDDKINARAKELGISIQKLTTDTTAQFHADIAALNVLPATKNPHPTPLPDREREAAQSAAGEGYMIEPRATHHIPQMIAIIEKLIANGHAYISQGHALFAVDSYKEYGQLSGRKLEELQAGARVEVESYKKHPGDFVLWKPADEGDDPSSVFDSPWGKGRPGWHIECSAMSSEYLGGTFDLHGGGSDLMFPHHENEIAQSRCADKQSQFAKYWVHNGFLTVNGEKMSKSLGNFITVKDLLDKGVRGEVIRLALLRVHYRKPLDWTEFHLQSSKELLQTIANSLFGQFTYTDPLQAVIVYNTFEHPTFSEEIKRLLVDQQTKFIDYLKNDTKNHPFLDKNIEFDKIINCLCDDINLSDFLAHILEISRSVNHTSMSVSEAVNLENGKEIISKIYSLKYALAMGLTILGVDIYKFYQSSFSLLNEEKDTIQSLIDARLAAKKAKNWAEADRIRKELSNQGIILEDRLDGTTDWRKA